MKFLWNNASRRSRQSFLWRRPSGGIVYPFLIWEGADTYDPTFLANPAWNTLLSGPAHKYLNLLSTPAGNTLDGLQSVGATEPSYQGIVTLPPLPASLSYTLNFSIGTGTTSISSPTIRAMNLGYPNYDVDSLIYLDFPKWEVGSFWLNNFSSFGPVTARFEFPEYRGVGIGVPQAAGLFLINGNFNFDFPKLVELYGFDVQDTTATLDYQFDCTFPILAKIEDLYIQLCTITGTGKTISFPALTEITCPASDPYVLVKNFSAPFLMTIGYGGNFIKFGESGQRLHNLDLGITTLNGRVLIAFMADLNGVFNLFGGSVTTTHGDILLYCATATSAQADAVWSNWASVLLYGTSRVLNAPEPTGGALNADVTILTLRGYTCTFFT
jgi:hypothetical protein